MEACRVVRGDAIGYWLVAFFPFTEFIRLSAC